MKICGGLVAIAALLAGSPYSRAQSVGTAVEIGDDDGVEAMKNRILAFVEALTDYTADVRVGKPELEAILTHYASLDEIDGERDPGGILDRAFRGGRYDFGVIVSDPFYVSWCRGRSLEPEAFFRGLLRLEALRMREEGLARLERARGELPAKRAELESMREKVGEEAYREGVGALEAAAEMVEETRELMGGLPRPSRDEARLLQEDRERIEAVLGQDDVE